MKLTGLILLLCIAYSPLSAQYFFTGEVHDLHGDKLQRVAVIVQSTGQVYQTGRYGDFEITSKTADDSLTFAYNGYEKYTTAIRSTDFLQVTLKMLTPLAASRKNRLSSLFSWQGCDPYPDGAGAGSFGVVENPFLQGATTASFNGNPDGISYNTIRRFVDMGSPVPSEAVKIEEMLSYFNFFYEEPPASETFQCSSDLVSCPWNKSHRLLCLNISARHGDLRQAPPAHIVFVIDASGSMDMPNKLPLIKAGMRLLVRNLRDIDTVSFVQYGSSVSALAGIPGANKGDILRAVEQLHGDGSSPGDAALKLAYRIAQKQFIPNGANRIVLITDGDVCSDRAVAADLADLVSQQSEQGITLSCIGVGMTDSENVELPSLAGRGKGNFGCMEEEQEGERLLLRELNENLLSVADSVFITTTFDSSLVDGYRLIGYDNKRDLLADTARQLQGSTISSAHSMMALFELIPRREAIDGEKLARVKIRYCLPGKKAIRTMSYSCEDNPIGFDRADLPLKRAACIALFGMKLKGSGYAAEMPWPEVERLTRKTFTGNNYIDREYINLVVRARNIYEHKKTP